MKYLSVAVDGPAGSGKSTITKMVASKLGFNYVDTGALYRTLTYSFLKHNLTELDNEKITKILDTIDLRVDYEDGKQIVYLNNENVENNIRTAEVSKYTSLFATSSLVRDFLIDTQRNLALSNNIIMDGRDIASVVLPNADVKIFLTASVEERAKRRFLEFQEKNSSTLTLEEVAEEIRKRDYQDENRKVAPLIKVPEAVLLDTTTMTIEEVVEKITNLIKEKQ